MGLIEPPLRKSFVSETPLGLEIIIPAKRNVFAFLFLLAWLGGWAFGEVSAAKELFFSTSRKTPMGFLSFWLMAWTLGGGFALLVVLWMLGGKERVTLAPAGASIKREVFGLGPVKEYEVAHIKNLRVASSTFNPQNQSSGQFWGYGGGSIAFDYGASTVRFGNSIDEAEAVIIVEEIKRRYPSIPA